jgi:carbon-monoxide dehydrogenase medium subunit
VKPAAFAYEAPDDVPEALALLGEHGAEARALAGGQSLVPLLNRRILRPRMLVDLNGIDALSTVSESPGALEVGATVRQEAVLRSELVRRRAPLLCAAVGQIAHRAIRSRGSIGGSLAHGDPGAELPLVALTLDASLHVRNGAGERAVAASDFFRAPRTTAVAAGELLVGVTFPDLPRGAGWAFEEFSLRFHNAPLVAVAAVVVLDADGRVGAVRIGLAGVGPTPVRARATEQAIVGQPAAPDVIAAAAEDAARDLDPPDDVHASPEYRRQLAAVLVRRTLKRAST